MEQKELTAVEYLENAIYKYIAYVEGSHKAEPFTITQLSEAVQQAKEMEKQQLEFAFYDGGVDFQEKKELNNAEVPYYNDAEQYYNEQYGKNNQSL